MGHGHCSPGEFRGQDRPVGRYLERNFFTFVLSCDTQIGSEGVIDLVFRVAGFGDDRLELFRNQPIATSRDRVTTWTRENKLTSPELSPRDLRFHFPSDCSYRLRAGRKSWRVEGGGKFQSHCGSAPMVRTTVTSMFTQWLYIRKNFHWYQNAKVNYEIGRRNGCASVFLRESQLSPGFVYRLRHSQNVFIQVHDIRVAEQKVEVFQCLG